IIIDNLGGVFGLHQIPTEAGIALTTFTMIVVINAYNFIDGVDGLAGGVGIIGASFFAWWFWTAGMMGQAVLSLALLGALLAFMIFNVKPASVFMGDTGSQVVGFVLAFLAVSFVMAGTSAVRPLPFKDEAPVLVLA